MLFEMQKNLFQSVVGRLAKVRLRSDVPSEPGRYIVLKTDNKALTAYVTRQDITAMVVLDQADESALNVNTAGSFAIDDWIMGLMTSYGVSDKFTVEVKPKASKEEAEEESGEEKEEAEKEITEAGTLIFKMPSLTKKKTIWNIPFWTDPIATAKVDITGANKLTVSAAELAKYVKQVGLALVEKTGKAGYRNVLIRSLGKNFELVTVSPNQLAWSKAEHIESSGDFKVAALHEQVSLVSGLLDLDLPVDILYSKDAGSITFVQALRYGDKDIGKIMFKINAATEPFSNFEGMITKLNFIRTIRFSREALRPVVDRVSMIDDPYKTEVVIEAKSGEVTLKKTKKGGVASIEESCNISADEDYSIVLSSRHLKSCLDNAESDDIELKFSGYKSLTRMVLSQNLVSYYLPYGQMEEVAQAAPVAAGAQE